MAAMSENVKMIVESFTIEGKDGETAAELAWKVARHFGTIYDGIPSDAGVAIAVRFEYPPVEIVEVAPETVEEPVDPAADQNQTEGEKI
jgi:hypothetical protein